MRLHGRLGALEEREFRLLWLSRVVSDFGDRFALTALQEHVPPHAHRA